MKKAVAGIAAICLLVVLTLWWHSYVHNVINEINASIDQTLVAINNGDLEHGLMQMKEARAKWEDAEGILALFLNTNLTDNIDVNFDRAESMLELDEATCAFTELRGIRHTLIDLEDSLEITLRNVI